jgi:Thioredoxin domain-containing protein
MPQRKAQTMSAQDFETRVIAEGRPTLVCFLEDWSAPCKEIDHTVDTLCDALSDRIEVCRMGLEEASLIAVRYGISSIPALVLFSEGEPVQKLFGLRPFEDIMKTLAKQLDAE